LMESPPNRAFTGSYPPPIFFRKAEAARSETQDAHVPDKEALFASSEGAKRPEILAARTGQRFSLNLEVGVLLPTNSGMNVQTRMSHFVHFPINPLSISLLYALPTLAKLP
ncbi:hypothetical protein SAMN04488574_14419, partial [Bacillus sp. 71mf]